MKITAHKRILCYIFFICVSVHINAQVGINTTNPEGALDIVATDQGVVMPRVSAVENVVTPDGSDPVDGTIVYDLSRSQMCMRINGTWVCTDNTGSNTVINDIVLTTVGNYIKASNTGAIDEFGTSVSVSSDGNYLAVGSYREASNATTINGDETNNTAPASGAVYIFVKSGTVWSQQAYIKASNAEAGDFFGVSVDLSADGSYLAVGALGEDSISVASPSNNSRSAAGAAYVFTRSGTSWTQQAYLKAINTGDNDQFGFSVKISGDTNYLAVGARYEASSATGINSGNYNDSATTAGAVYVYVRSGTSWTQQAYIKASNTNSGDFFSESLDISQDGSYLAVGAKFEDSNAVGVNGDDSNNFSSSTGAVYVFERNGTIWTQQAYIKASNAGNGDFFGASVSISDDGSYLAVGATGEDAATTEINGDETDNGANNSGAAYIFQRNGTTWSQIAYLKAPNAEGADNFGYSISISGNGRQVAVGATLEDSAATDINGDQTDNFFTNAGAVYSFKIRNTFVSFNGYIKASNTDSQDYFGYAIALNLDGSLLAVSANREDSAATGIGGSQTDNTATTAGAVYIIE